MESYHTLKTTTISKRKLHRGKEKATLTKLPRSMMQSTFLKKRKEEIISTVISKYIWRILRFQPDLRRKSRSGRTYTMARSSSHPILPREAITAPWRSSHCTRRIHQPSSRGRSQLKERRKFQASNQLPNFHLCLPHQSQLIFVT